MIVYQSFEDIIIILLIRYIADLNEIVYQYKRMIGKDDNEFSNTYIY